MTAVAAAPAPAAIAVDVAFDVAGTSVPADHAWALLQEVEALLPWLADEPAAGIHPLRTAPTTYGVALLARCQSAGDRRACSELTGRSVHHRQGLGCALQRPIEGIGAHLEIAQTGERHPVARRGRRRSRHRRLDKGFEPGRVVIGPEPIP